jgi:hypothetical protein
LLLAIAGSVTVGNATNGSAQLIDGNAGPTPQPTGFKD